MTVSYTHLGVCNIATHDNGAGERQAGGYRVLRKLGKDLFHRAVKVDFHCFAFNFLTTDYGDTKEYQPPNDGPATRNAGHIEA